MPTMNDNDRQGGRSLIAVLQSVTQAHSRNRACTFLPDGLTDGGSLTFEELDRAARAVAAYLQAAGAVERPVLVACPPSLTYVVALLGCIYAGATVVSTVSPGSAGGAERVAAIAADAAAGLVLTPRDLRPLLSRYFGPGSDAGPVSCVAVDEVESGRADEWRMPEERPDSPAFIMYSSGTTGAPKGVVLSGAGVLWGCESMARLFRVDSRAVYVSWAPVSHILGSLGAVLLSLLKGSHLVLMPPDVIMREPGRWLKAIARYRGTVAGGPNFLYDLCLRRVSPQDREGLDLSSLVTAFNGAEPVRAETMDNFAAAFAACGLRPEALLPIYGASEAFVIAGGGDDYRSTVRVIHRQSLERGSIEECDAADEAAQRIVGYRASPGCRLLAVDPQSLRPCPPGRVGEIWVESPSVALGYWNRLEESAAVFGACPAGGRGSFWRSGDLGFIDDGTLFITGRLKDLIIVKGRNYYPQDIEATAVAAHPALAAGPAAAFSIEAQGEEAPVVVAEVEPGCDALDEAGAAVQRAVALAHGLWLHRVVFTRCGVVPRTSVGKVRRHACRSGYIGGKLPVLHEWDGERSGLPSDGGASGEEAVATLCRVLAQVLGVPEVRPGDNLFDLGADSITATVVAARANEAGLNLNPQLLFQHQTVAGLVAALEGAGATTGAGGSELRRPTPTRQDDGSERFALADLDQQTLDSVMKRLRQAAGDREGD